MRILVLAPQPFFELRGTPIAVRLLLEALAAQGHELDVIVFAEGEDVEIPGCRFTRVPRIPGTRGIPPGFSVKKAVCDVVLTFMAAGRMLRRRYDLIHAVEEAAFIARALRPIFRTPYVYDLDSSIPQQIGEKYALPGWIAGALIRAERSALRGSRGAITCCRALEEIARAQAPDIPVATIEDISLLDSSLIEGDAANTAPLEDCRADRPVVMYVGNLEPYQGIDLLIEGFAQAQERTPMQLVVIGGTAEAIGAYEGLCRTMGLGDSVRFLGPRPITQLGAYLARATIVASPRLQGVNTPMKVYSYLDSGSALLATKLLTHTQVLDDQIACLVAPTPEGIADGLVRLVEDPALRMRLAAAAKARVRAEFSQSAFREKIAAFYARSVLPGLAPTRAGSTA